MTKIDKAHQMPHWY